MRRRKAEGGRRTWRKLKSGLYVPPFLKRLHRDEVGGWFPCCREGPPDYCGTFPCYQCVDNIAPDWIQIYFTGVVNQNRDDCTTIFEDYKKFIISSDDPPDGWHYKYVWEPPNYEYNYLLVVIGVLQLIARITFHGTPYSYIEFSKSYDDPPDCWHWEDEELAFVEDTSPWCSAPEGKAFVTSCRML